MRIVQGFRKDFTCSECISFFARWHGNSGRGRNTAFKEGARR
jgi:hypothetical protein